MIYAEIDNVADECDPEAVPIYMIVNRIVLDDPQYIPLFAEGHAYFLRVDNLSPEPGIDWTYDPELDEFTMPPEMAARLAAMKQES